MAKVTKEQMTVEEVLQGLESCGWQDGRSLVQFEPYSDIGGFYVRDVLQKKVMELNKNIFDSLEMYEREELWDKVMSALETSNPVWLLDALKYGVEVIYKRRRLRLRLFDYENPANNIYFYLQEVVFVGEKDRVRPDITLFVNGLPLVIIEVKDKYIEGSFRKAVAQINRYEQECPRLFSFVQLGVAYGDEVRYMGVWPNVNMEDRNGRKMFVWRDEQEKKSNIMDLLQVKRILPFIYDYVFFAGEETDKGLFKIVARYVQYYATEKAFKRARLYVDGKSEERKGLIWHWQGSGKTFAMFFLAQKFFSYAYQKEPIVFFILDRRDLVRQLFTELGQIHFAFKSRFKKVETVKDLIRILKDIRQAEESGNLAHRGLYVTTLQKFRVDEDVEKSIDKFIKKYGEIEKREILLLVDEAHRSIFGDTGALVQRVFKNALWFGFTGTPILQREKNTFDYFAYPDKEEYYLDRYFISQSIKDKFTLPIAYTAIKEKKADVLLDMKDIKEFVREWDKYGDLEEGETKVSAEVKRKINNRRIFLGNPERIKKMANYIAERIEQDTEDFLFKAMVVAVDRKACVQYKKELDRALQEKFGSQAKSWSEIVMSYQQNETDNKINKYVKEVSDRYEEREPDKVNRAIVERFKKKADPRILIVTDMLLTGFDAPDVKVMYLDKPLYGHRLLQAIARVNRLLAEKGKRFGLIVDSIGILGYINQTMEFYNSFVSDEALKEDFKQNLLRNTDKILSEFEKEIKSVKDELKNLRFRGEDLFVDVEKTVQAVEDRDILVWNDIDEKLGKIALYLFDEEVMDDDSMYLRKLWGRLRHLLQLYVSLGAHPNKVDYIREVGVIKFLVDRVRQLQRSDEYFSLDQSFWQELNNFIVNNVKIGPIQEVGKAVFDEKYIETLNRGEVKVNNIIVADYYFTLVQSLKSEINDPIYKEIYEKIQNLRNKWVQGKLELEEFFKGLQTQGQAIENYKNKTKNQPIERRIVMILNKIVNNELLSEFKELAFTEFTKVLKRIIKGEGRLVTTVEKKMLAEAFLTDLFVEAGNVLKPEVEERLEQITQKFINYYVIDILESDKSYKIEK